MVRDKKRLNFYNRENNSFNNYTEKNGLSNDVIYGILGDDEGNLWLSSNNGITEIHTNDLLKGNSVNSSRLENPWEKPINYTTADGLQSPEFNFEAYYKSIDGEMFFGGINGFNSFYPKQIKENKFIPPVYITNLKILNNIISVKNDSGSNSTLDSSVFIKKEITLSYKENIFSFEFAV